MQIIAFPRNGSSAGSLSETRGEPERARDSERSTASVIVHSRVMLALYREMEAVARGDINVLILGETGVGKDVLAKRIHERSGWARGPFVRLNCAALPEGLIESELFGFERGAFTGADRQKPGLLQLAHGGSIFLDEIGDLPRRLQAKLLHVLETREVLPLGATRPRTIDTRFLAASNRDLEAGGFRNDLYYRIAGYTAHVPPLRERRTDILPLAKEFLRRAAARAGAGTTVRIRNDTAAKLVAHAWPGNVRELRNVVERAFVLAGGRDIGCEHLRLERMCPLHVVPKPALRAAEANDELSITDLGASERAERTKILEALARCGGNQSSAAKTLGVSRSTLLNRLDAYRIQRPRKRPH